MPSTTTRRQILSDMAAQNGTHGNGAAPAAMPTELFGQNVFSLAVMRQVLPRQVYQHMVEIHEKGIALEPATADVIAAAMKDWATQRGATHYCHWFHPLTGLTAEKHTSFMIPTEEGGVITEFTGANLLQGEPDASSFPSGGIRSTFEARGYTGWDPTSSAFLMEGRYGKTLCIPSVFLGFGGQALDKKAPLLRSSDALSRQALRILRLFGNTQATRVYTTVGAEQEYFLVDRRYYLLRPDLITCGRTLFGARPSKGQEMEDHYFGAIKERALAYMEDLERELYKLGIPVTTRHNEVAPSQYEFAPIFEPSNVATDHNMLMMSVMKQVARRHGFECLLHEKPFAGVNGSGKHNNWSMADDLGSNLLDPGHTPQENAQFLVFLTAVIRAVHRHADLLRASVASPSNDHRLGANEAPPAIISVYLGETLSGIVQAIIDGAAYNSRAQEFLNIGVMSLPALPRHDSDRNRTSPFAFTGEKFEFRAVGSGQSIARPNMVLNTIVAQSLGEMAGRIESELQAGRDLNSAVRAVIQSELREHQAVLFSGDNYSAAWHVEAEQRGLPNLRTCVEAIAPLASEKAVELFVGQNVLNQQELQSRCRILLEHYIKTLAIEAAVMSNIGRTMILPAALEHQANIASSVEEARDVLDIDLWAQEELVRNCAEGINRFVAGLNRLDDARRQAEHHTGDMQDHAAFCRDELLAAMLEVRTAGDALELIVEDALWPLPKYREMLFLE